MYQDEMRMKVTCSRLADVDYQKFGHEMFDRAMKEGIFGDFALAKKEK